MCPFYHTFFHTVCLLSEANDAKIQKSLTNKPYLYGFPPIQSTNGLKISQIFPLNAEKNQDFLNIFNLYFSLSFPFAL